MASKNTTQQLYGRRQPENLHIDKKVNIAIVITVVMNLVWGGYIFGVNKTILDTHSSTIQQIIQTQKKLTDSTIQLNINVQTNTIHIDSTSKSLAEVTRTLRHVNENQIRLQSKLEERGLNKN
tara:strand:+ start:30628 stop:30996 length:369 start_codon:yes stop_codon:yes gene_type:complete